MQNQSDLLFFHKNFSLSWTSVSGDIWRAIQGYSSTSPQWPTMSLRSTLAFWNHPITLPCNILSLFITPLSTWKRNHNNFLTEWSSCITGSPRISCSLCMFHTHSFCMVAAINTGGINSRTWSIIWPKMIGLEVEEPRSKLKQARPQNPACSLLCSLPRLHFKMEDNDNS